MIQNLYLILFFFGIQANEFNEADICKCYCCPSDVNPYKDKSAICDPLNPPLVGSVPIGVGAGDLACNALSCSGYFSIECPPAGMKSSRGAAVRAGCKSCSQGPFGNGSASKDHQSEIDGSLKDYLDKGNAFENSGYKSKHFLKLIF